jgi:hypothetical protein
MDIYDHPQEIRLGERRLSEGLGVSRSPYVERSSVHGINLRVEPPRWEKVGSSERRTEPCP